MLFDHENINELLGYETLERIDAVDGRRYITPNGNAYPSVTNVLSLVSEDAIKKWRESVGVKEANDITKLASLKGTNVHEIVEKYLKNDENYKAGYMPHTITSFKKLQEHLDSNITKVYGLEVPLYSEKLRMAGTCDCIAEWNGVLSVIDFKTSRKRKTSEYIENYFMQTTAYAMMWNEITGKIIEDVIILMDVEHDFPSIFKEKVCNWTDKLLYWRDTYEKREQSWGLFNG